MSENLGIEHLEPAVISLVQIANAGNAAAADGIQPVKDLISMLPSIMALPTIQANFDLIIAQAQDIDSEEAEKISVSVATTMNFGSDKAKRITKKAILAVAHIGNLALEITAE